MTIYSELSKLELQIFFVAFILVGVSNNPSSFPNVPKFQRVLVCSCSHEFRWSGCIAPIWLTKHFSKRSLLMFTTCELHACTPLLRISLIVCVAEQNSELRKSYFSWNERWFFLKQLRRYYPALQDIFKAWFYILCLTLPPQFLSPWNQTWQIITEWGRVKCKL